MNRALIIESNHEVAEKLEALLVKSGIETTVTHDGRSGLNKLRSEVFHIYYAGIELPDMEIHMLLGEAQKSRITAPAIILTSIELEDDAIDLGLKGAHDYLITPIQENKVLIQLSRTLRFSELEEETERLRRLLKKQFEFPMLTGSSPLIRKLNKTVSSIADTNFPILIKGESGSGRSRVARALHYNSSRSRKPFIHLSCYVVPESLLETELLGFEFGAFGQGVKIKPGKLEAASGGTIFLEDIHLLHPTIQRKLLPVLRTGEFQRVGGTNTYPLNLRILASTQKDLKEEVAQGRIHPELDSYFSNNTLLIPPLRKRKDDIQAILENFLKEKSLILQKPSPQLDKNAIRLLQRYNWPGNVSELEAFAERLVTVDKGIPITIEALPKEFLAEVSKSESLSLTALDFSSILLPQNGTNLKKLVEELEYTLINQALERSDSVKTRAAKLLGLKRTTLIEKLKKQG